MNRFEFNTGDHKEEEEKVLVGRSYGKEVLYRFRKNKGAWISFFIIILLIVNIRVLCSIVWNYHIFTSQYHYTVFAGENQHYLPVLLIHKKWLFKPLITIYFTIVFFFNFIYHFYVFDLFLRVFYIHKPCLL